MRHANRQRKLDHRKPKKQKRQMKPTSRLETNRYGNVAGIPDGWKKTNMSVKQLVARKIPFYRACLGFERNKYGEKTPVIVNIVPVTTKPMTGSKPNCHLTPEERQKAWERRLVKLTWCSEAYAHEIAEAKLAYKEKVIAKLEAKQAQVYSAKRAQTIERVKHVNPLRRIINAEHAQAVLEAHERHTRTDYDQKLAEGHELVDNGILTYTQVKTYARNTYKPNK